MFSRPSKNIVFWHVSTNYATLPNFLTFPKCFEQDYLLNETFAQNLSQSLLNFNILIFFII